jgi:HSP20 family protein
MLRPDLSRHPLHLLDDLFAPALRARPARRTPPLEIRAADDRVTFLAPLPGLAPDTLDVSLERGELRVRAERQVPTPADAPEQPRARVLARELDRGPVDLRLRLGFRPDAAAIEATYALGVLRIDVPRAAEERPRRIPVTTR